MKPSLSSPRRSHNGQLPLSPLNLRVFKWWSEYKQRKYSKKFEKRFEEIQGRKILKEGENKIGRPK